MFSHVVYFSMYGFLGFTNLIFYANPLAELITSQVSERTSYFELWGFRNTIYDSSLKLSSQGWEILQSTADIVQNHLNLKVRQVCLFLMFSAFLDVLSILELSHNEILWIFFEFGPNRYSNCLFHSFLHHIYAILNLNLKFCF